MTKQVHIHIHRTKARDAGEGEGRWITLSPSGTHVKVDGKGEITAGPKGMAGKKPSELSSGPKQGEVGHSEHQKYGAYFKKGEQVRGPGGKVHEVFSHVGPAVETSGGRFHPTKVWKVTPSSGKAEGGTPAPGKNDEPSTQQVAKHAGKKVQPSKPGWALRADPVLAAKFEAAEARSKAKKLERETGTGGERGPKGPSPKQVVAVNKSSGPEEDQLRQSVRNWKQKANAATNKADREWAEQNLYDAQDRLIAYQESSVGKPGPDGKPMGIHPALAAVTPPGFPTPGSQEGNKVRVNQATGELSQVGKTPQPQQADWSKSNGDWTAAKKEGAEMFERAMSSAKSGGARTDAALKLKAEAAQQQKNGSYLGAVVLGLVNDYFDRLK